ncbi:hypothetical protein F5887DRAFT_1007455 [Amanita rubescens]|nr:hypothetical protein F5887DRAFT_1007455 [Amanita rubescens]
MSAPDDSLSEVLINDLRLAWAANYGTNLNMLTIHSGGPLVFSTFSNVILMLRVHALYNRSRGGEWMLLAMIGAVLYTGIRTGNTYVVFRFPGVPWPGCMATLHASDLLTGVTGWVANLIPPTILFLLTMWNLIHSVLSARGWRAIFQRNRSYTAWRIPPLFTAFFRDGTVHYFYFSAAILAAMTLAAPTPLEPLIAPLILNLRVAAAHLQGSTPTWHQTFSIRMPDMATYSDESTESDQRVEGIEENPIELQSFA